MSNPQSWKMIHDRLKGILKSPTLSGKAHQSMVLSMYKQTLSELKIWPSIKRARVRQEVRSMYRQSVELTETEDIQQAIQSGKNGLQSLVEQNDSFVRNRSGSHFTHTLRGPF